MPHGAVIVAAKEERFIWIKHASFVIAGGLPFKAIAYCCATAGIEPHDLDRAAFQVKPGMTARKSRGVPLGRSHHGPTQSAYYTFGILAEYRVFQKSLEQLASMVGGTHKVETYYHHMCHAASSFLVSPYDEAAVLAAAGRGKHASTCTGVESDTSVQLQDGMNFRHSLGFPYGMTTTNYLGFLGYARQGHYT